MAGRVTRNGQVASEGLVWHINANNRNSYPRYGASALYDLSDFKTPGFFANGAVWADSGSFEYIRTDGVNDTIYPQIPGTTRIPGFKWGLHWDLDWTFETWVTMTRYTGASYAYLYGQYNGAATPTYPASHTLGLSGLTTTAFIYFNPSIEDPTVYNTATFLRTETASMQHIVVTMRDGTEMRTYRNGAFVTSSAYDFKNTGFGRVNAVNVIKVDGNNKIWVGGTFARYNDKYVTYGILKLNADGTIVDNWNTGSTPINPDANVGLTGFNHKVYDIEFSGSSANLYGQFNQYKNNTHWCGVRIDATGSRTAFVNPASNYGLTGRMNSAGTVYYGVTYSNPLAAGFGRLTRTNAAMSAMDPTFISGSSLNANPTLIRLDSNEKPIVIGTFTSYSGSVANRIARINTNGTLDTTFNAGTGFNNTPLTMITASDGKIYVGGTFTLFSGSNAPRIVRINTNGTHDPTFNPGAGFNNNVLSLATDASGRILAAGAFTTYSGSTVNRIVRINTNGTLDTTFNMGTGFDLPTLTVDVAPDGKIYVGGQFFTYSGSSANGIVGLNEDGTINTTFDYGTGFSRANDRPSMYTPTIGGNVIGFIDGNWSEIRMYNRALTATEVLNNYNATKGKYGL